MKSLRNFSVLIAVAALFTFTGCPYSAEVPIDEPSVKIDDKLLGKWEGKSSSDYVYTVTKHDGFNYQIEKKSVESPDDVTMYLGYLSDIGGSRFLNVYEKTDDASSSAITYYFYKADVSSSGMKLTLLPVTENIDEKFATSQELKDFFKKHMNLSFFYEKEEDVFIKVE